MVSNVILQGTHNVLTGECGSVEMAQGNLMLELAQTFTPLCGRPLVSQSFSGGINPVR